LLGFDRFAAVQRVTQWVDHAADSSGPTGTSSTWPLRRTVAPALTSVSSPKITAPISSSARLKAKAVTFWPSGRRFRAFRYNRRRSAVNPGDAVTDTGNHADVFNFRASFELGNGCPDVAAEVL
jgi:chitodextrinase